MSKLQLIRNFILSDKEGMISPMEIDEALELIEEYEMDNGELPKDIKEWYHK